MKYKPDCSVSARVGSCWGRRVYLADPVGSCRAVFRVMRLRVRNPCRAFPRSTARPGTDDTKPRDTNKSPA